MMLERRLLPRTGGGRRSLAVAILLGVGSSALFLVQATQLARLLGAALAWRPGSPLSYGTDLAGLALVALARALLSWAADTLAAYAAADVRQGLRLEVAGALLDRGPRAGELEHTGALAAAIGTGIEATDAYVARYVPQLAWSAATPLIILAAVWARDGLSALVLAATWPLIPLFMFLIGRVARRQTTAQWATLSKMAARFVDGIRGASTLVAFDRVDAEVETIRASSERFRIVTLGVLRIAFLSALTLEWLATLGTAIVAVQLGLRLLYGRIAFEPALFVLLAAPEFYRPLRALGAAFHAAMTGREAAQRIEAVTSGTHAMPAGPAAPSTPGGSHLATAEISFERVGLRYSSDRPPALSDFTVVIPAGRTVALVGPSGAGKSTVAHLLLRFARPDEGRILVSGADLAEIPDREWRRQVAWLPQRPRLFHGSVLENLRLARPDASPSEIDRALVLSRADDVVRALPGGLAAAIGEGGARLSGGQAQRLALARVFLKDAPLVILDEPTSHLDAESDALVTDAIRALAPRQTVLLIAHRLTTVATADAVVVMNHGRIVEVGRPDALARSGGAYTRMLQAAGAGA